MRHVLAVSTLVLAAVVGSGCMATKAARLGAEEAVQPRVVERISTGNAGPVEIRCGIGELCEEINVVHVQRDVDGGVEVTLRNRTQEHVAVQVGLDGYDESQRRSDRTGFHEVILAPRGDGVLHLDSLADIKDTIVLNLRPRVR
ncbi:MAG TPA: hypothetical protein VGF99_08765 [Myxococcota bacterium]